MHPEIEKLILMALEDGIVTEKEREIIIRKSQKLNLDEDEVEMYLESKISKFSIKSQDLTPANNKHGDLKKCPSCGSHIFSFTTFCKDCGHEFKNISKNLSVEDFINKFNSIEKNTKEEYFQNGENFMTSAFGKKIPKPTFSIKLEIEKKIQGSKIELISFFEVPNSKEEILSFLAIAISGATKNIPFTIAIGTNKEAIEIKNAWKAKSSNLIFKSRLLFKDDIKTIETIENYAKQLKI